jgi:DNA-binding MurR/RpiR family transcriptional regulator
MNHTHGPAKTADELRAAILERYDGLSKRLQQVARHILDQPHEFGIDTLAELAARSDTQPSTIVRFAKYFGFDGASSMQRLFRDALVSNHKGLDYGERARNFRAADSNSQGGEPMAMLREFIEGSNLALQNLPQTVSAHDLERAIRLVMEASTVYVVGFRRSFPVSSYLAYALQQAGKRTFFMDGVGGLANHQVDSIGAEDLLVAISYPPYAQETLEIVQRAIARRAHLLSFTDTPVSPIAKSADAVLLVKETEVRSFRSLSASLCLAQALAISVAFRVSSGKNARKGARGPSFKGEK